MPQGEFRRVWKKKEADETALWNILANIVLALLALIAVISQRGGQLSFCLTPGAGRKI